MSIDNFHLLRPPVIHVLLQIQFGPAIQDFGERFHGLDAEMERLGYPDLGEGEIEQVVHRSGEPTMKSKAPLILFMNRDHSEQLFLSPDSIVIQASKYLTFSDFEAKVEALLPAVVERTGPRTVRRVGLRYVNFIEPCEGKGFSDYLASNLLGRPETDLKVGQHFWRSDNIYEVSSGLLSVRCSRLPNQRLLPPGVEPLGLSYPRDVESPNPRVAVLDIDRVNLTEAPLTLEGIRALLRPMNNDATRVFRESVTEDAAQEWGMVAGDQT